MFGPSCFDKALVFETFYFLKMCLISVGPCSDAQVNGPIKGRWKDQHSYPKSIVCLLCLTVLHKCGHAFVLTAFM